MTERSTRSHPRAQAILKKISSFEMSNRTEPLVSTREAGLILSDYRDASRSRPAGAESNSAFRQEALTNSVTR